MVKKILLTIFALIFFPSMALAVPYVTDISIPDTWTGVSVYVETLDAGNFTAGGVTTPHLSATSAYAGTANISILNSGTQTGTSTYVATLDAGTFTAGTATISGGSIYGSNIDAAEITAGGVTTPHLSATSAYAGTANISGGSIYVTELNTPTFSSSSGTIIVNPAGSGSSMYMPTLNTSSFGSDTSGNSAYNGGITAYGLSGASGFFWGDGSQLTNIGGVFEIISSVSGTAGDQVVKGLAYYITAGPGNQRYLYKADCTSDVSEYVIGLASTSGTTGAPNQLVYNAGLLTGVSTSGWTSGDALYLREAGVIDNNYPINGVVKFVGTVIRSHATVGSIYVYQHSTHYISVPSGHDIDIRMGDSIGVNKFVFGNYDDVDVGWVDSLGKASFDGGISTAGTAVVYGPTGATIFQVDPSLSAVSMYALVNVIMPGTSAGVIGSAIYDSSGATAVAVMQDKTAYFGGTVGIGTPSPDNTFVLSQDASNEGLNFFNSHSNYSSLFTGLAAPRNNADFAGSLGLYSTNDGGLFLQGYSDSNETGLCIAGMMGAPDPTDTMPAVYIKGYKWNGADSVANLGNTETILGVANGGGTNSFVILGSGSVGIKTTSPNSNTTLDVNGIIGAQSGVSVGATSPISGLTSFVAIDSGVSPTGSMTRGAIFYVVDDEMWVNNGKGTHTQISTHDPETGELYVNSYNAYTGIGEKFYPKRNEIVIYTVPKINPEEYAKEQFVKAYMADKNNSTWMICDKEEAVIEVTKEVITPITDTKLVKKLNIKNGQVESVEETYTLTETKETVPAGYGIKDGYRLDPITALFEKRVMATSEQAETKFQFNWAEMPKFVRNAWGK